MAVQEQVVELPLFFFHDYRGDSDDVCIPSFFLYVNLYHDVGFVQINNLL